MSSASRKQIQVVKVSVCLFVAVILGIALYMTWEQVETTSCQVGPNERIVLYGGEGNRARILPPGEHPLAGYSYDADYVVPMGEISSSFVVRIEQGKLATLGHTLKQNRWTRNTPLGDFAESLTPQPVFLKVKLVYDLDESKLQRLVDDCNDQPFEQGILPGLVNNAFVKASKEQGGGFIRSFFSRDSPLELAENADVVADMKDRIEQVLEKRFGITLKEFEIIESMQRDLAEGESARPAYMTARPAPASATIKMPPTRWQAFMGNIGQIIGFIVIMGVVILICMFVPDEFVEVLF